MPPKEELSPQPLDSLIEELGLKNADVVRSSTEQLTFKQLAKARAGKPVTLKIQQKIANALNRCIGDGKYVIADLFDH